ncbi:Fc.00g070400.m01.CDS01 [Cosmosporella sp. VM-42]
MDPGVTEICETREWVYSLYKELQKSYSRADIGTPRRRIFHRNEVARRGLLRYQFLRGRPIHFWRWCGDPKCEREQWGIERPLMSLTFNATSSLRLPVSDYIKDFAEAVAGKLCLELEDANSKLRKRRAIHSLIDSPPVRAAFWRFDDGCAMKGVYPSETEDLQKELIKTRIELEGLVSGGEAKNKIQAVHRYLKPTQIDFEENWKLRELIMQFLITTEVWRQYGSYVFPDWSFDSNIRTTEFLTALLLNYWVMRRNDCFDMDQKYFMTDRQWDEQWTRWMDKYPLVVDEEQIILRQEHYGDEETVLEEVGYLGGIGTNAPAWTPPQRRRR